MHSTENTVIKIIALHYFIFSYSDLFLTVSAFVHLYSHLGYALTTGASTDIVKAF